MVDQLQSVDDYFPLFFEQTLELYALRMKDNEDQVDTIVNQNKTFFINLKYLFI
jgi:hypothetical protein